jgi:hypothetical protein
MNRRCSAKVKSPANVDGEKNTGMPLVTAYVAGAALGSCSAAFLTSCSVERQMIKRFLMIKWK